MSVQVVVWERSSLQVSKISSSPGTTGNDKLVMAFSPDQLAFLLHLT
jgi:hypothetical protein